MTIEIAAYSWVPPFARGYVRDVRERWALGCPTGRSPSTSGGFRTGIGSGRGRIWRLTNSGEEVRQRPTQ